MTNIRKTYKIAHAETTDVIIGSNLLDKLDTLVKQYKHTGYILLSGETTKKLYADKIITSLKRLNVSVHTFVLPKGESNKNMESIVKVLNFMLKNNLDKRGAMIAMGGGVTGDVATVIAGLYYRGIDCIQIPSTLLAQVDSAHGGKGGANINEYKNMIGLTRQPTAVIVDTNLLRSLSREQIRSGLGEILKYAIAHDKTLFEKLERLEKIEDELGSIIYSCIDLKMKAVIQDPLDIGNVRIALNFGHSLGHAVEITSHLTHGKAVAVGMTFAIKVSSELGLISEDQAIRALTLIKKFDLPQIANNINIERVREIMKKDKKNIGGKTKLVLLEDIGKTSIQENISEEIINKVLKEVII